MAVWWFIMGAGLGGLLGWLIGYFGSRYSTGSFHQDITGHASSGALFGMITGLLITAIVISLQ
jgi:hypothetical protein